jgi:hypothetical protein
MTRCPAPRAMLSTIEASSAAANRWHEQPVASAGAAIDLGAIAKA